MATNWLLLFCVQTCLCAVAVYFTFLLFTYRRFQIVARPRSNTTGSEAVGDREDVGSVCANTPVRSSLNFGTLARNFNRQSNTPGSPSLAGTHIAFIPALPRISARNPEAYFQMIEPIFEEHEVTTERAKFSAVVTSLRHEQDVFDKVSLTSFVPLTRVNHTQFLKIT